MRIFFILLLLNLLCSCASLKINNEKSVLTYEEYKNLKSNHEVEDFNSSGKFTFFIKNKGFNGKLKWKSSNNSDTIFIFNPFNSIIAKIRLDLSKKKFSIFTIDDSVEVTNLNNFLSENNNIFLMRKFVLEKPLNKKGSTKIKYDDWIITYENELPGQKTKEITFEKNNISLNILFLSWTN